MHFLEWLRWNISFKLIRLRITFLTVRLIKRFDWSLSLFLIHQYLISLHIVEKFSVNCVQKEKYGIGNQIFGSKLMIVSRLCLAMNFYWNVCTMSGKWTVYQFSIAFSCSDSVVFYFIYFHCINTLRIFLDQILLSIEMKKEKHKAFRIIIRSSRKNSQTESR